MKKIIIVIIAISLFAFVYGCTNNTSTTAPPLSSATSTVTQTATATSGPVVTPTTLPAEMSPESNASTPSNNMQSSLPLTIMSPTDGSDVNGSSVTVSGHTAQGATINVGDQVTTADSSGNFSLNVNLDDGPNALDVIATNDSGNRGEVDLMVNSIPSTTPTATSGSQVITSTGALPLTVTQPTDGATLNTNDVTIIGRTVPGATVTVNSVTDVADAAGNFSIALSLDNGPNALDVIAMDNNGNQGEVLLMVNVAGQ